MATSSLNSTLEFRSLLIRCISHLKVYLKYYGLLRVDRKGFTGNYFMDADIPRIMPATIKNKYTKWIMGILFEQQY